VIDLPTAEELKAMRASMLEQGSAEALSIAAEDRIVRAIRAERKRCIKKALAAYEEWWNDSDQHFRDPRRPKRIQTSLPDHIAAAIRADDE
jgi:hypothetical protein